MCTQSVDLQATERPSRELVTAEYLNPDSAVRCKMLCLKNKLLYFQPQLHHLAKQGVSSHGKPGKVMQFHFLFPGLEKSWNLTPGFGKSHGN